MCSRAYFSQAKKSCILNKQLMVYFNVYRASIASRGFEKAIYFFFFIKKSVWHTINIIAMLELDTFPFNNKLVYGVRQSDTFPFRVMLETCVVCTFWYLNSTYYVISFTQFIKKKTIIHRRRSASFETFGRRQKTFLFGIRKS